MTQEELNQATTLGEQLVKALAHGEREIAEKRRVMTDRSARAFTLLCQVYDDAQRRSCTSAGSRGTRTR